MDRDVSFGMILEAPDAYQAHQKGFARAIAAGVPPERAAAMCGLSRAEVGAFGGFKKLRRMARAPGRTLGRAALHSMNPIAVARYSTKLAARGLAAATGPIRRRIFRAFFKKLIDRRARFLSWQRRKGLIPAAADLREARAWTIAYVKRSGFLGRIIGATLSGDTIGEPVTAAALAASIPVILELARRALRAAEKQGAPADPRSEPAGESANEER